jgi:tetratricopeptide (TPR) repeat protein
MAQPKALRLSQPQAQRLCRTGRRKVAERLEQPSAPEGARVNERLDSWKEIAAYLQRDVRTVQRWERREALPVHRHFHDQRGSIYAYRSELESWRKGRRPEAASARALPCAGRTFTVGRARERAALRATFESAAAGQLRLVSVTGEPGIGKTTLVEDFLRELTSEQRSCTVVRGRCSERLASAEAYAPFFEALDSLLHASKGRPAARLMKRVAPTWYRILVPAPPVRVSDDEPGAASRIESAKTMHLELATLIRRLCRMEPFVLFLDDVQWADAPSIDLLAYLTARLESTRLFVIAAYRPSDLSLAKSPFAKLKLELESHASSVEVQLGFLSLKDIETYLELEFPDHRFPPDLASLVQQQTEGNPLFVVELLQYLRGKGVLASENNQWVLAAEIPDLTRELPISVLSVIARHLGQLSESDRQLLTIASVQGDQFDSAVIAGVLQRAPADVEERLDILDRTHALVRILDDTRLPDGTFTLRCHFVHVLYQQALYGQLQPTRKAEWSAALAHELLAHHRDRIAPVAAQLALLFETARNASQAAEYLSVAAERATHVFAFAEAVALATRGLRLLKDLPDSAPRRDQELRLQLVLGLSLSATKGFGVPEIAEHHALALALCQRVGNHAQLSATLSGLSVYHTIRGELSTARELTQHGLRLAEETGDAMLRVQAHYYLAQVFANAGQPTVSLEHVRRALALYDPADHQLYISQCRRDTGVLATVLEGWPLWTLGYPDQAVRSVEQGLTLARRLSHPLALAEVLAMAALVHLLRGEADRVSLHTGELLQLSIERGIAQTWLWAKALRGWAIGELGDPERGVEELRECLGSETMAISELMRPLFLALTATLCVKGKEPQQGLTAVAEALTHCAAMGQRFVEPECYRLEGECTLMVGGCAVQADVSFERAIQSAKEQGARSLELRGLIGRARLKLPKQKRAETRQALADAYSSFTEGFDTPDLRQAKAVLTALD